MQLLRKGIRNRLKKVLYKDQAELQGLQIKLGSLRKHALILSTEEITYEPKSIKTYRDNIDRCNQLYARKKADFVFKKKQLEREIDILLKTWGSRNRTMILRRNLSLYRLHQRLSIDDLLYLLIGDRLDRNRSYSYTKTHIEQSIGHAFRLVCLADEKCILREMLENP